MVDVDVALNNPETPEPSNTDDIKPAVPEGEADLEGIGPGGKSGLNKCDKFNWAMSFGAVWVAVVVTAGMRNVYTITFGGSATALGVLFVVLSFILPLSVAAAGVCLKSPLMPGMFPVEK